MDGSGSGVGAFAAPGAGSGLSQFVAPPSLAASPNAQANAATRRERCGSAALAAGTAALQTAVALMGMGGAGEWVSRQGRRRYKRRWRWF